MIHVLRRSSSTIFWLGAAGSVVLVSWLIGAHGLIGAIAATAILIGALVWLYPELLFMASILTIIIGQVVRLSVLGAESSIIPNDIILPVLVIAWLFKKLTSRTWKFPRHSLSAPLWAWLTIMSVSLVAQATNYSQREFLSGALYLLRWLEYATLFWMALDFCRTRWRAERYLRLIIWTGVIIAGLGFIQLYLFPDFSFMVPQGWDPHVGRLLSTWFDPNFLGGYLSLLITIALAIALSKKPWAARWWWAAIGLMTVAVILTFSRSAYVALAVGTGLVALIRSRTIFFLGLAAFLATIFFVPRVQERVVGIRTIDETAKLRLVSWNNALAVIHDHPWVGVGYNLYRYVQVQYNFVDTAQEHSASGSDSSFLTAWVTTGVIGLSVYLWLFIALIREAWKTWQDRALSAEWQGYGLGLTAGLIGLFAHSQFVNSFFYPHIMEAVWILIAMAIMVRQGSPPVVRQPQSI